MLSTEETREDLELGLAAEVLRRQGTVRLKAWGMSMLPSLWPGDVLTIQSAQPDEVVPGDIVLVLRDSRFFIHRLIEKRSCHDSRSWITRGDAMPHNDPPAAPSEVLGRVAVIRRAHRSFVPSRRISLPHSTLAWMLCRCGRFRNLALRIHAASLQTSPLRGAHCLRALSATSRGIPSPPSRTAQR